MKRRIRFQIQGKPKQIGPAYQFFLFQKKKKMQAKSGEILAKNMAKSSCSKLVSFKVGIYKLYSFL